MPKRSFAACALFVLANCAPTPARLSGSHVPERVARAVDRGAAPADEQLRLVVALAPRGALAGPGAASETRPLTRPELADRFGPTVDEYLCVVDWLEHSGLSVVRTSPLRTTVTVEGSAIDVERALAVHLRHFEDASGTFRAPDGDPSLPSSCGPSPIVVLGLDDAKHWSSDLRVYPNGSGTRGSETAGDLATLYNTAGATQQGSGETVAILGAGLPPDVSDVKAFALQSGLSTDVATQYKQVLVGGPNRDDLMTATDEQFENVLDVEMVFALAPKANVVHVIVATNTPGLFTDGISYIVNQLSNAHAVSLSYGSCERFAAAEMPILNLLFAQARAEGQQWFAASGDTGTNGCRDGSGDTVLSPGWPASSPSVIGVGGTQLTGPNEVAWGFGGGGKSEDLDKPAYQAGVGPYPNDGVRDEPDVAALAGGPGVQIVIGGGVNIAQGTSAAAPMWAGVWARIDEAKGGTGLPKGIERLYALGAAGTGLKDITAGANSTGGTPGFTALTGFDLATGWGSPNVAALVQGW